MNKKAKIVFWLFAIVYILTMGALLVFENRWRVETELYACDWEWDDDFDRYDVFVPELLKHFYVRTKDAHIIVIDDDVDGICKITTRRYLVTESNPSVGISEFYINIYSLLNNE